MLVATWPAVVQAELHALLVGVSGYKDRPLKGPRNDVQRMQQVLLQRTFKPEQITVLADGLAGAGEPTRARILAALDRLASAAKPGDTVFIYMAGHGSQQPANRNTPQGKAEPDGLHEIFLPLDIGGWDGSTKGFTNAIVDFELREKIDRIQAAGAFVWAVFDACHSASLVRSGGVDELRYRHISPADLGAPAGVMEAASVGAMGSRGVKTAPGFAPVPGGSLSAAAAGAVYFYAAQTTERAPEMSLPLGDPQRRPYGLLTFTLARALEQGRVMSYRQLGQYVLAQYVGMNEALVTPVFSGNGLDLAVLGQQSLPLRQWPLSAQRPTLPVGALSGIAPGALFAVVPSALSDSREALGHLRAEKVELTQTEWQPTAHAGKPAPRLSELPPGAHARLLGSPERYSMRLALDHSACTNPCRWQAALDQLRANGVPGADVQWVSNGADWVIKLTRNEVRAVVPSANLLGGASEQAAAGTLLVTAASPTTASASEAARDTATALAARLHGMARASNLLRLAARLALNSHDLGLQVTVAAERTGGGGRVALLPEAVASLASGDRLVVTLSNQSLKSIDVTLLYADAKFGVSPLYPSGAGEINRLEPGARHVIDDIALSDEGGVYGIERLLVIAVAAEKRTERTDFSFLAQPPVQALRARSAAVDDDVGAFFDAAFAEYRSRNAPTRTPGGRTGMQVFTFDVAPGRAATRR